MARPADARVRPGSWGFRAGLLILGGVALMAALGRWLAPYRPAAISGPPLSPPGPGHFLGTNDVGQDLLSELLWGTGATAGTALGVVALGIPLAWLVGLASGWWRRAAPPLLLLTDFVLALPFLPLALLVLTWVQPGRLTVILTLAALLWPTTARIVRAQALTVRTAAYAEAARALGGGELWVLRRHVGPATLALLPSAVVLMARSAVFAETTLTFLGLADPAERSWGATLGWAFNYPLVFSGGAWLWWVLPPTVLIALLLVALTWVLSSTNSQPR
ncbi:MAG: ABC transporter permease [Chloroflexi bacterium]|nr:ABC transporter permease [Chloroflexota bacterium]